MKTAVELAHGVHGMSANSCARLIEVTGQHSAECERLQAAARAALAEAVGELRRESVATTEPIAATAIRYAAAHLFRSFGLDATEKGGG